MALISRAQWGARPANGGPGALTPSRVEGIAFHWPAMSSPLRTVRAVKRALRGWQDYHMDGRGWSDIAYQVAVDQAGNRYELRGLATQSGANGDADVNERFGAVLLILAPGERPSKAMCAEARRVVADHRNLFPNSKRLAGHCDIRPEPTACPGPAALTALRGGRFDPEIGEIDVRLRDFFRYQLWGKRGGNRTFADAFRQLVTDVAAIRADVEAIKDAQDAEGN